MAVRVIDIDEAWDAALPLMQANWRETGDSFEFAPSREFYVAMQNAELVVALGAFHEEVLHGYALVTIAPHPFNPAVTVASCNPLYVDPQFRSGVLPGRLILLAREVARTRKARRLYWHARAGTKLADTLIEHGCEPVDNVVGETVEA